MKLPTNTLHVLYVEDDKDIRENTCAIFENCFSSVVTASNGQEGLEQFKKEKIDLVITDIKMPVMDGIEMIDEIFKINPDQVVIVTSAHQESQHLLKLINLGVEYFLAKPMDLDKMLMLFSKIIRRFQEHEELKNYQDILEVENLKSAALIKELAEKNSELEKTVAELTGEINVNIALIDSIQKETKLTEGQLNFLTPATDTETSAAFIASFPGDIEKISDNLESIEDTLELLIHQKLHDASPEDIQELSLAFTSYAKVLFDTYKFKNLAQALENFGTKLLEIQDLSILKDLESFLFGIADSLQKWRIEVFVEKSTEDIHFMDNSIISDCLQTSGMFCVNSDENSAEDDGFEFF